MTRPEPCSEIKFPTSRDETGDEEPHFEDPLPGNLWPCPLRPNKTIIYLFYGLPTLSQLSPEKFSGSDNTAMRTLPPLGAWTRTHFSKSRKEPLVSRFIQLSEFGVFFFT
ncbi:hypothetical protein AVEN_165460-1 [Araneus ventricosus]|uniref:Uncharacterized protein n=1 Tax=Araneus ventricosus TaxID=182803 RepID=A0A4Y2HVC8_ARAVE|nr:hypothetical protein AVEN_165460-1 [Araneus ventricosus]